LLGKPNGQSRTPVPTKHHVATGNISRRILRHFTKSPILFHVAKQHFTAHFMRYRPYGTPPRLALQYITLPQATFHAAFCGISQNHRFYFTLPTATFHRADNTVGATPCQISRAENAKFSALFAIL